MTSFWHAVEAIFSSVCVFKCQWWKEHEPATEVRFRLQTFLLSLLSLSLQVAAEPSLFSKLETNTAYVSRGVVENIPAPLSCLLYSPVVGH